MQSPAFLLWDVDYTIYTCGSILIIVLIIWQVKKRHQKLMLTPSKSCCQHQRRDKHRSREKTPRANKSSQKEAEKLQKLLSTMKSQGWLPQKGSVRRLLCRDPSCQICNTVALEIQQWLVGENKQISPTVAKPSHSCSCLRTLSTSSVPFEQSHRRSFQNSRELFLTPGASLTQLIDQKSLPQSASQSTGGVSIEEHWSDPLQSIPAPHAFQDVKTLSSPNLEEPEIPVNWKEKTKSKPTLALMNSDAPEVDLGNTMTFFSHWINPEVKCQRHEELILHPKSEAVADSKTKEVKKVPAPTKDHIKGANLKVTGKEPETLPCCTKEEQDLTSLDACTVSSSNASSKPFKPGAPAIPTKSSPKSTPRSASKSAPNSDCD
ncbi:protein SPATA31F3 isoform X1 [Cavia porcellus]|uniref:protein SPATA31F3 isoform X1 n=1 Tax=Cavia porcellus TaxID=10141 RepID=UPI002FE39B34